MTGPLTLGTAGHIDHGKTTLVRALTGVDTDRLPGERERGISIELGYAPLWLPSGRRLSLVDVPGHERFVRTMVAGASGIDLYLMVVAADDGVMPQTVEHAAVLRALDVRAGVVAITKADLADPSRAEQEARALLPDADAVVTAGVAAVADALESVAARLGTRAELGGEPRLHVDRSFTVTGLGPVVTGTLWSGTLRVGDTLALLPGPRSVRVRGLQVHDEPQSEVPAGQRVAVNLAGVRAREVARGDVLTTPGSVTETTVLDCELALADGVSHGERVQVHHGTRDTPGRLCDLGGGLWQLRLEKPVLAADGDRVVVRRLSPPDTLGGGRILDASAKRHGRRPEILARLRGEQPLPEPEKPEPVSFEAKPDPAEVNHVLAALTDAGLALLNAATLSATEAQALAALRADGQAVRISGQLYAQATLAAEVRAKIVSLIKTNGSTSLAEVRDALGTGRKTAQAFLEHLDTERLTRRQPDDRRVLR
ncbi:MAG: selenocysteine-specific translation elongation factor [Solirubrobacterales bacterium]|nr:selenocysteine-specific translation elongation factor [Solirubrobacterales bacterium]